MINQMSVLVLYTDYNYCMYKSLLETYNSFLTQKIKEQVYTFRRWQDRQAFILGKLLIWEGLKHHQYDQDCLSNLQINSYGKPYIDSSVFFNLSHSGQYVICAFYKEEIGIDIEKIERVEIDDFKTIFSDQELNHLRISLTPLADFFRSWTIKESVIKADGQGLSLPLQLINTSEEGIVQLGKKTWYVKEVNLFQNYCCSIATLTEPTSFLFKKIDFEIP
jgi:4'-phosphopantetheinyl transferase